MITLYSLLLILSILFILDVIIRKNDKDTSEYLGQFFDFNQYKFDDKLKLDEIKKVYHNGLYLISEVDYILLKNGIFFTGEGLYNQDTLSLADENIREDIILQKNKYD